jgi:hypothetical protein
MRPTPLPPLSFPLLGLALVAALLVGGCSTTYGSRTVPTTRFDYNEALAQSWNQQMLLNLVRLRYRDTPQFLDVSSVLAQFTFGGSADASVLRIAGPGNDETGLGAGVEYSERPTITYTPLQGKDFAGRLLTPISPATIVLLSQSGWSIERLMLCCVHQINGIRNAPSAAGPTPDYVPRYEEFHRLSRLLRELQKGGALSVALRQAGEGEAKQDVLVVLFHPQNPEQEVRLEDLAEQLGLEKGLREFRLTTVRVDRTAREIGLAGRPLTAVLFFLSQAVEAPAEHEAAGLVTVTRDSAGERFDWSRVTAPLLRIRSQAAEPASAFVKVRYRGWWFFIDDADLNSKTTFGLLHFLFSLQSEPAGKSPLLTVSTGG